MLICKICGAERSSGRRLCKECNRKRSRDLARSKPKYMFHNTCVACNTVFDAWRKQQRLCKDCYNLKLFFAKQNKANNNYIKVSKSSKNLHREIAENALRRKLSSNEVIHHIDDNHLNNDKSNLLLMSRSDHGKLHSYLDEQRVIVEKSANENPENCWKSLIVQITTAWLEMTNANVLKISEIGQSAAEPLS